MFWKKNNMVIGDVVSELYFRRFAIGELGWKWRRKYFSRLDINPKRWINPHMLIVGESGGGKSNACKVIVSALCKSGARVAILDPHNEYLGISEGISASIYDAARNGMNIFEHDGMSDKEKANEITGMIKRNFRLGDVQGYTLYRCIMYTYQIMQERGKVPSMHDLIFSIKVFKKNSNTASEKNILESLERRLLLIDTGAFMKSVDIKKILSQNSIFLLSGLHTNEAQSIYIEGFLRKIYSNMLVSKRDPGSMLYVVIDEAQKLGDNPIIGRIAAEGRKYGVGIIAMSQRAKPVDKDLRANASLLVSFNVREPEELNYIANFMAGGNEMGRFIEVKKAIRNLGVGYAVISGAQKRNPFVARFSRSAHETLNLGFTILQSSRGGIKESELIGRMVELEAQSPQTRIGELVKSGELKECQIECGRYSGTWYISDNHNSPEHDITVGIISRHLKAMGINNAIYNSSYGPDVVAFCRGKKVAVEYETGSKDILDTKEMVTKRADRYANTIVFVNDRHYGAYSKEMRGVLRISELERTDLAGILLPQAG